MNLIDLRSPEELALEDRGRSPLDEEDEASARQLVMLCKRSNTEYDHDQTAYDKTVKEIHAIGETLCQKGGDARMKLVAYRFKGLGGRIRDLEMYWDGVCGWMA